MAKNDKFYFDNLYSSVKIARTSAALLVECLEQYNRQDLEMMLQGMHVYEQSADTNKHDMGNALAKAFVTPIEREDLDILSHKIDDVIDKIEEILQNFYIYNVQEVRPDVITFAKHILRACDVLCEIMLEFANFKKSKKVGELVVKLNDIEEECDVLYLECMHSVTVEISSLACISDKISHAILDAFAWRKIFECLESCADACEHVGECVETVIMKNT